MRLASRRLRHGHIAQRLHYRIIAPASMTPQQRTALALSYAVLFCLALMTAFHSFFESTDKFRIGGAIQIPLTVFLTAVPIMILIMSFAASAAILSNAVTRWGCVVLAVLMLIILGADSTSPPWAEIDPVKRAALWAARDRASVLLEMPAGILLLIVLYRRRLHGWALPLGCVVTFSIVAALVWWLNQTPGATVASTASLFFLAGVGVYLFPALLVVGVDIAEWSEIIGDGAIEGLPATRRHLPWAIAGLALAANLVLVLWWAVHSHQVDWHLPTTAPSHGSVRIGQLALAFAGMGAGLAVIFALLIRYRSGSDHQEHFRYPVILAMAYVIIGGSMYLPEFASKPAPPPTQIFRLKATDFSIDPAPDWKPEIVLDQILSAVVDFFGPGSDKIFAITVSKADVPITMLDDIIGADVHMPPARVEFSTRDADGWRHFETTLTRYGNVKLGMIDGLRLAHEAARPRGIGVLAVKDRTPSAEAGFQPNDIIVAVNGQNIADRVEFIRRVEALTPGASAEFSLLRNGQERHVTVRVSELPDAFKAHAHFDLWKKDVAFEAGRTDIRLDRHYLLWSACPEKDRDCAAAVESMRQSWSPTVRTVPSRWGGLAPTWSWLAVAAVAACLIPWRRRRTDARLLTLVAVAALAFFSYSVAGLTEVSHSAIELDVEHAHMWLEIACAITVVGSLALMTWTAASSRRRPHLSAAVRLIAGFNLSVLALVGAFELLLQSSQSAEESNLVKALVVILALTWEITASGSITNIATRHMPRAGRLLLFLAYVLLVALTVFMFFPSRYGNAALGAFNPDETILVGMVVLGLPIIFAAFATRAAALLGAPPTSPVPSSRPTPVSATSASPALSAPTAPTMG